MAGPVRLDDADREAVGLAFSQKPALRRAFGLWGPACLAHARA
jgi:hypothetical protein